LRKVIGQSDYQARAGSNTGGANAVFWVDVVKERPDGLVVVRNLIEGAKVKVDQVAKPIETTLLYPLLRGRDADRWRSAPSASIIIAQDPQKRRGYALTEMQKRWPKTHAYLKQFEKTLRERAAYRRYFDPKRDPFYSMFNISHYTLAPWKVVWREMAETMTAAVVDRISGKPVVPDHKLMLVACASKAEAHFLCAALNSTPARMVVSGYTIEVSMDPHILGRLRIPKFDPKDKVHKQLAELSIQAHELARMPASDKPQASSPKLQEVEAELDVESAKLWNLSPSDLAEIQRSLKELQT